MKNILIFNDISGLGNCSLAANLPLFTKLGHYCMPVVTATFSCQTGFESYSCQPNENIAKSVFDITKNRLPNAIFVGFCTNSKLLQEVAECVAKTSCELLFVDPILGDNGKLYSIFDEHYVSAMKKAVREADCISPNLTEACLLAEVDFRELASHQGEPTYLAICGKTFENFLQKTGARSAVVTGVECGKYIGNIVLEKDCPPRFVTNERVSTNYSGTGDVFSSVLLGQLLNGATLLQATQIAANFVGKAAAATQCTDRRFGVEFFRVMDIL